MNKQHYQYVLTLDSAQWPRKLADELLLHSELANHLVSVTDLQNARHIYGATYSVPDAERSTPASASPVPMMLRKARQQTTAGQP